jgi:hypothetical protein
MFNILSHKGNASQNDIGIPSHPNQNGCHHDNKQQMVARMQGNRNLYILLVGM